MSTKTWSAMVVAAVMAATTMIATMGVASAAAITGATSSASDAKPTVVSLTFDDGYTNQLEAASIMDAHDMKATFYVSSGLLRQESGTGEPASPYMTSAELLSLQGRGHEIGGHTVSHVDLVQLEVEEAKRQVCTDRATLTDLGLRVTSFAYPFASLNDQVEQIPEECGYNSARGLGDILSPELPGGYSICEECPVAETIPPGHPFNTAAPNPVENTWTLASLQETVTNAETTGGWLQLTFHHVDNTGSSFSVAPELLEEFVEWLANRESRGTVVKTVDAVIGGEVNPAVPGPRLEARPEAGNLLLNPSLEEPGSDGDHPRCWQQGSWGQNNPNFSLVQDARTGSAAGAVTLSGYVDGDAKLMPMQDLGSCAPAVSPGESYELRGWYTSDHDTQFEIYTRNAAGGWSYWTSSPPFPVASTWSQATFRTPEIPDDVTALSFGLNIAGNGTLVTDDYEMYEAKHVPAVGTEPRTLGFGWTALVAALIAGALTIAMGLWARYSAPGR